VPDWRSGLPTLTGKLVTLREVTSKDAWTLFEFLTDPAVTTHISPPPPTLDAFGGFILWAQRQRSEGKSVCFGIVPHGLQRAVGIIQLRSLETAFLAADWGFAIGAAFWATGAFAEAAELAVQFAFETLGVNRLEARAAKENGRGNGALQRMGAAAEAELMKSFKRPEGYGSQLLWSLNAADWQQWRLSLGKFSPADATARIEKAIENAKEQLKNKSPRSGNEDPPLYPFFISDPGQK
jgi:RimJ/RimL family protein N-acetyltransferase